MKYVYLFNFFDLIQFEIEKKGKIKRLLKGLFIDYVAVEENV